MTPPSDTPAPERRLAVLLAHLRPPSTAELLGTAAAAAEAGAGFSASPCAAGDTAEGVGNPSGGGRCVFCNIVAGASPAFKLYEDDVCLFILDAKLLAAGHSLVIPKNHYPSLQTTPPAFVVQFIGTSFSIIVLKPTLGGECGSSSALDGDCGSSLDIKHTEKRQQVLAAICSKLPLLGTAIMKATQCDAFNVLINNGEKAGQVIFHTHIHIIPHSKDDNLWSSETYSRSPISHDQETKNLVDSIKEVLLSSPKDYSTETPSTTKEL